MKKLRLDLDTLHIHSFETEEVCSARGTVAGAEGDPKPPAPCGTLAPFCWCTAVEPGVGVPVA